MADKTIYQASVTAPVNIAVIKYWGKRDVNLNLPTNSSLSVTLSQSDLCTHTTAACSPSFSVSEPLTLILNGVLRAPDSRTNTVTSLLRTQRRELEASNPLLPNISSLPIRLTSENNFPTAAGLASSASGYAALVCAIADLYTLPLTQTELSKIARQGSGSACRSLFGGYVAWRRGERDDGTDSIAEQVATREHWPGMRALVLVVSAEKKKVSSTAGMQATVATSPLFQIRANEIVPVRMAGMEKAVLAKDFDTFGRITMRDSNNFHATCLDTDPPIFYMTEVSRAVVRVVEAINLAADGNVIAAYTFDAGPNAVIYFEEENMDSVAGVIKAILKSIEWVGREGETVDERKEDIIDEKTRNLLREGIVRVISTSVGDGPISIKRSLFRE